MATQAPPDLPLQPLEGTARTVDEWLTTFHLVVVVLDPYTSQSAWLLPTAGRILRGFVGADCRVAFLVTADAADTRSFLGPWADEILTLIDPDREAVKALGLDRLPALVHINQDRSIAGLAQGWDPDEWRPITAQLATLMSWSRPSLPAPGDPGPFEGSAALG
ncbi:hypothetical protein BH20ACT2_BH20ACT2_12340 [soil metagenome]